MIEIVKSLIPDLEEGSDDPEEQEEEDKETMELYDMFHMAGGEDTFRGSVVESIHGPTIGGSTDRVSVMTMHFGQLRHRNSLFRRKWTSLAQTARKRKKFRQNIGHWESPSPEVKYSRRRWTRLHFGLDRRIPLNK